MVVLNFYAVNNQLVLAQNEEDAIKLYYTSRTEQIERGNLESLAFVG